MLTPVDESGRFYPEYGWLAGRSAHDAADDIIADLRQRGLLVDAGTIHHRYPECWRCHTPADLPHLRRLVHLRRRDPRADAGRQPHGRVDARVHGQAHGRLARQHVRLEHLPPALLRAAPPLLPVRLRPPHRDRLACRSSPSWPPGPSTASRSCAGPGSTTSRSAARSAATRCAASPRSATCGSTPASCRSPPSGGRTPSGSTRATPPAPPRASPPPTCPTTPLGGVVPRRLGVGDARADPPVVLLAALHVGGAHRPGPVPQGARLREDARRDRPGDARLVGQHDLGRGRLRPHGRRRHALAVLRPAAEPEPAVRVRARARRSSASSSRSGTAPRSSSSTPTSPASPPTSPTSPTARRATTSRRSTGGWSPARAAWSPRSPTPTSSTSP